MRLQMTSTTRQIEGWKAAQIANRTHPVDVMDCVTVLATAHQIFNDHPEVRPDLLKHVDDIINGAGELGIVASFQRSARATGLSFDDCMLALGRVLP
jgi:hypothetical protein